MALPTPSTSHVSYATIYEPAEDSFLFLDTLSSAYESQWLHRRFTTATPSPLLVEVGTGSGVILAFTTANSLSILGRRDILALATDLNVSACHAASHTVSQAIHDQSPAEQQLSQSQSQSQSQSPSKLPTPTLASPIMADLCAPLRPNSIDILLFNPPYVPTPEVPAAPGPDHAFATTTTTTTPDQRRGDMFDRSSYLLSLAYAGGDDGMEITNRLLDQVPRLLTPGRGVAYFLFCKQNHPDKVRREIVEGRRWPNDEGAGWNADIVGDSGLRAGREKLCIMRIWRD